MPRMPKWLADFSEKTFKAAYKQTVITEVEYYAPKLKRIRYQGDALRSIEWKPAPHIGLHRGSERTNQDETLLAGRKKRPLIHLLLVFIEM